MEEFTKQIFLNAIIKEQAARRMYLNLANQANDPDIRNIFHQLADEELMHESLFKKQDIDTLRKVNSSELTRLNLLKEIKKTDSEEITKTLDFAIQREQEAHDDYALLINHFDFGEARDVLKEIATQELRHKVILEKIKLEFNKNDWSSLK